MGYEQKQPTVIDEDNQSCIKLATNPVRHKQSKHIDTKFHFIREKVEDSSIKLIYVPSEDLAADALTKSLSHIKLENHRRVLMGEVQTIPQDAGTV